MENCYTSGGSSGEVAEVPVHQKLSTNRIIFLIPYQIQIFFYITHKYNLVTSMRFCKALLHTHILFTNAAKNGPYALWYRDANDHWYIFSEILWDNQVLAVCNN